MVTVLAGAVAVGIVSVCAIPFGCFVSRRLKRKVAVVVPPEVGDLSELIEECQYEITPLPPKPSSGRPGRVRIRVLVSNGSPRSMDLENPGYVTASGASASSSSRLGASARQAIEARERISLPNPATNREIQGGSSSLPAAIPGRVYDDESNRGLNNYSDTTRFEITISGGASCRSIAQFGDFKSDVQDSSTPKSRSAPSATDCSERVENRSGFWRRISLGGNAPPKIFKATRDVEVINIEITPEGESCEKEKPCDREAEAAATSSQENGRNFNRGRWGLRGRFLETLKETTSFANL